MLRTFRELQGIDAEPIDFEWKIFPGGTALDFHHIIQKDQEGKRITVENFNDRSIFMSWSTTLIWTRKEINLRAIPLREESKSTPQVSKTDTGHSWDPEKKASGIKDMQSIVAASGFFVFQNVSRFRKCRTSSIPREKSVGH